MSCTTAWPQYLYGLEDDEFIAKESVEEVVEEYIEENFTHWVAVENSAPDYVEVHKYKRMELSEPPLFYDVLDSLIERIDEDYGNWVGPSTQPEPAMAAMKAAEAEFVKVVREHYHVWQMESCEVIRVPIDLPTLIEENEKRVAEMRREKALENPGADLALNPPSTLPRVCRRAGRAECGARQQRQTALTRDKTAQPL